MWQIKRSDGRYWTGGYWSSTGVNKYYMRKSSLHAALTYCTNGYQNTRPEDVTVDEYELVYKKTVYVEKDKKNKTRMIE